MGEPPKKLSRISFGTYTAAEILDLSVKEISNAKTFDALGHTTVGGLYDRALGPSEKIDVCGTCGLNSLYCPGHLGHIQLPVPVYHPLWIRDLLLVLRGSCFNCHKLFESNPAMEHVLCVIKLLDADLSHHLDALKAIYCELESKSASAVIPRMKQFVEQKIAEKPECENGDRPSHTRHMNLYRSKFVQDYVSEVFTHKKGHCSHCFVPTKKLRLEHHSKLFFDEGASTRGINQAKRAIGVIRKKQEKGKKDKKKPEQDEEEQPTGAAAGEPQSEDSCKSTLVLDAELEQKLEQSKNREFLTPMVVRDHLRKLWDNCSDVLQHVFGMLQIPLDNPNDSAARPTDILFMTVLPVSPNRFRPLRFMNGNKFENARNAVYCKVLENCDEIKEVLRTLERNKTLLADDKESLAVKRQQSYDDLHRVMLSLQISVNAILDCSLNKLDTSQIAGVRQTLEKKDGLFRKHMMGKRVDFAARSVISPDPFISVDEIGIPEVFATKLTFPEYVTPHNVERLREAVLNGPNKHPGATHVVGGKGQKYLLTDKLELRETFANSLLTGATDNLFSKPKAVCRHLRNGDMLLLNRQPTLHRPSIQAHKAHVLPGEKTIRLHYANCKAYNADFDGDEMNAHFPQHFIGQSEARVIATTQRQYLVPKDGTPLAGLIQDHMIGGVNLCMRGSFFTQEDYQQLVFSGLTDQQRRLKLLPPAILKPTKLWSGKQVISTVLRNLFPGEEDAYLNLSGTSKIPAKSWINGEQNKDVASMGEETVVIRQGELVQGVLDKNHYGSTPYGLVHSCYELYGGSVASELLTSLARLFTTYLSSRGFTLGVKDILCKPESDVERTKAMVNGRTLGAAAAAKALDVEDSTDKQLMDKKYAQIHFTDDTKLRELDIYMKKVSDGIQNDVFKAVMLGGLLKQFPHNNLQLMVISGAKGSTVNCMQISCLLGQIELEGRRPPITLSGRSLPSFLPYDTTPRAGGFIDGRFLSGIKPQEYFFHCMAGREGLVDTAVKTSRSGYLQRCLIKHLEGIVVGYDSTVRDSDGSVIQFLYGEDGLDVCKTNLLKTKQFPFLIDNYKSAANCTELEKLSKRLDKKQARKWERKIKKYRRMFSEVTGVKRLSPFLRYSADAQESSQTAQAPIDSTLYRTAKAKAIEEDFRKLSKSEFEGMKAYGEKCPEPTLTRYPASKYLGSMPEKFRDELTEYTNNNPDKLLVPDQDSVTPGKLSVDQFEELISLYNVRSQVEPGDGVGIIAAQSIGEPSTQMTLNTFHFAGRGEMNVTLGIPRLREILMVASKTQKTPSMDIPFKMTKHAQRRAKNLQLKLNVTQLSEVIEKVDVYTHLITQGLTSDLGRVYKVRIQFLPPAQYSDKCLLTPRFVLRHVEKSYIGAVTRAYAKVMKLNADIKLLNTLAAEGEATPSNQETLGDGINEDDNDIDEDIGHDGDATISKELVRQDQEREYDGEDEEMLEVLGEDVIESESGSDADEVGDDSMSDMDDSGTLDRSDLTGSRRKSQKLKSTGTMDQKRINEVIKYPGVQSYTYDADNDLWCEVTYKYPLSNSDIDITPLLTKEAKSSIVCDPAKLVRNVSKAILSQPKNPADPLRLKTEGVNIRRMFQYEDVLDLNNLYTNDIHAMADNYGIEAACRVLITEIRNVFAAYGIAVNYRHLTLIADYLTYDGEYKAFNRSGICAQASAFQKMSYEACLTFLKTATLNGAQDDLESPSARIIVGRPVKVGTGSFDLQLQTVCEE